MLFRSTAGRGLDLLCHLHHFLVVEVQAGDGVVALGMLGLLLSLIHICYGKSPYGQHLKNVADGKLKY